MCTCTIVEPKLTLKPPSSLDLGIMCIGQSQTKFINIKNSTKNSSAVIHVESSGLEGLVCGDKFLMRQDESKDLEVRYKADKEGEGTGQIQLKVRGSKDRTIECKAKCVKPVINFQELIDFQYAIVAGYPGVKTFTLNNTSEV